MILDFCSTSRDYCTAVCGILAQGLIISKKTTILPMSSPVGRRFLVATFRETYLVEGRFNFKKVSRKVSIDFIANAVCRGNSRDFV